MCSMTGELVVLLVGWYAAAVFGNIVDDNDRLAAIQEDQTAKNPGKVLVRYGSRVNEG